MSEEKEEKKFDLGALLNKTGKPMIGIKQFISQNNITMALLNDSDRKKISLILQDKVLREVIQLFVDYEKIHKINKDYLWDTQKLNEKELKHMIVANYREDIKQLMINAEKIIRINLKIDDITRQINNNINITETNIKLIEQHDNDIVINQQKLVEQNDKYLKLLYKQNKMKAELRKELADLENQEFTLITQQNKMIGENAELLSNLDGQRILLMEQHEFIDQQEKEGERHIDELKQNYFSQQQKRSSQRKQLEQSIENQKQMNRNFEIMAETAKKNNEILMKAQQDAAKTQADAIRRSSDITKTAIDESSQKNVRAIESLGQEIQKLRDAFNSISSQMSNMNSSIQRQISSGGSSSSSSSSSSSNYNSSSSNSFGNGRSSTPTRRQQYYNNYNY